MNAPLWLTVTAADLPLDHAWLGARERDVLAGFSVPHRRRDWMLGRLAAKRACLVAAYWLVGLGGGEVEIIAAPDGAPEAWLDGRPAPFTISLSHSGGLGACLVVPAGVMAGCDVELVERRALVFAADWFTDAELALVNGTSPDRRDLLVTLIWSAKESVLKAVRQGLRVDPRHVEVRLTETDSDDDGWRPLAAIEAGRRFEGWWRREGQLVMTAGMDPADRSPVSVTKFAA
jgi:4'-phosphopantetheinyl transferase